MCDRNLSMTSGILYYLGIRPSDAASGNQTWMVKISTDIKRRENTCQGWCKKWIRKFLRPATQQDIELLEHDSRADGAPTPAVVQDAARRRFPRLFHYFLKAFFNLLLCIWRAVRLFLALWAWGDSQSILIVLAYFGFAAWNTYDIIDLKKSNWYLVQDESAWGFGQVLPVVLLLLVFLNILDAVKGGWAISS